MAADTTPKTLLEAIRYYSDLDICQQELAEARWPNGVECPTCGRKDVSYLPNQRRWQCKTKHARRQFSVKVGTIFEDSAVGLDKWFAAMWMIAAAKNGISSHEIARAIGVTQKTAWFMLHRIRLAMQTKSFDKIKGEVEVDETYIGGRARFMHREKRARVRRGRSTYGKVAVMGLLERHGDGQSRVKFEVLSGLKKADVQPLVREHVAPGSKLYTDAFFSYSGLNDKYVHNVIDHAEKYAEGQVHTNGLENFWSLLKRALKGTYVSVEPFHLFRYLDEQAYRFNTRRQNDGERFSDVTHRVTGKRLTYADLIGRQVEAR
jgi:transposase-like protein